METNLMSAHLTVAPANIQSALTQIWESLEGTNKIRASLFNLILYTEQTTRTEYVRKVAQKVIEKFPARVIFITADKHSSNDFLNAKVSVMSAGQGELEIACDLIEIEVAGAQQTRVPFVILPLILPDLPVYVLWAENPTFKDNISLHLEKFATRLIFDSECTDNLPRFASSLLSFREKSHCDIADLNWARMEAWRDALSRTFYSPEKLSLLQNAKEIKITYNAYETTFFCHTRIQPIYLQGWLACQLGWILETNTKEKNNLKFSYRNEKQNVLISLIPESNPQVAPGMILSFDLTTYGNCTFSFNRCIGLPHKISMMFSTPDQCEMPSYFIFPRGEIGQSLAKEIGHKGTSSHYLKILDLITKMDGFGLC
jgi:glucose-6-phosphate dehydrogenase assembly protein OpcA